MAATNNNTNQPKTFDTWRALAEKVLTGRATPEEEVLLEQWYQQTGVNSDHMSTWEIDLPENKNFGQDDKETIKRNYKQQLLKRIHGSAGILMGTPHKNRRMYAWSAAAAILLLLIGLVYFIKPYQLSPSQKEHKVVTAVVPGSDGAILTLSNGHRIVLDSSVEGQLAVEDKSSMFKNGGTLRYKRQLVDKNPADAALVYNTITTPKGRQFKLILPDGTSVWLNAASSIHYPTAFTGKTREVQMTGEVYFEVAHNAHQPFIVHTDKATVEVLGTHFDMMAYSDERTQSTTLLEGKVLIRNKAKSGQPQYLQPGQQAVIEQSGQITVCAADTDQVTAWVNGKLSMKNLDVATLLRQIARWYNIEIHYMGAVPKGHFGGVINRKAELNSVLAVMEINGIRTHLKDRILYVAP